jgi:O-antigen/teichoic acid export membrane protein
MQSSIERRALKNTLTGALSFFLTLGQTIVLVPVLLKCWGNTTYGLWLTLMAGFNLLQTLDVGHHNYIGNELNMLYHTDKGAFQKVLGSSVLIAYFLGVAEICICVGLIFTGALPLFLSVPSEIIIENQLALGLVLLMSMWLVFGSMGGIIVRILIPAGMLYQGQWMAIIVSLSQFLSIVVVAGLGGGILAACLSYAIIQSVMSLLILWYIKVRLPEFFPWWHGADWRLGWRNLGKSTVLTANGIAQQLANNGLIILIAALFTSAVIPSFTTLRTLTNTAAAVTTVIITALMPEMIRYHAKGETNKLLAIFNANWFISGLLVNFGIVLVLPFIVPLYRLWTRGHLEFNAPLFFLLACAISLTNFGSGLNQYLQGINDLRAQTMIMVTRVCLLFLASWALSGFLDIVSIGIGCVLAEVFASVVLPVIFVRERLAGFSARLPIKQMSFAIIAPVMLLIVAVVIIWHPVSFYLVSLILFPGLCIIYYFNWKSLNGEVREKILSAALKMRQTITFSLLPTDRRE